MSQPVDAGLVRRLYPGVLARTLALTRSLPDAEDAVQEAIARALERWPADGAPESPEAWLVTVAANAFRDRLRRGRREDLTGRALDELARMSPWVRAAPGDLAIQRGWNDELLRLLVACCHPALEPGESAALALATVIGLSTAEIAAAFLVAPRSMEQRLTRARQRLRERGDAEGVSPGEAHGRLDAVLRTIHLLFNEGYWSTDDQAPIRADLCRLAVGLARSLVDICPGEPEAAALLALLLLHEARAAARLDHEGSAIPLPDQDRTRWDRGAIAAATALLEESLAAGQPGPYQIEAAIAAVHCRAAGPADTDWREIAALYELLETYRPSPAVRVNRAFAAGKASGAAEGLALLDATDIDAAAYPYVHAVRAALLEDLGRRGEAIESFTRALAGARNPAERAELERRIAALRTAETAAGKARRR